MKTDTDTKRGRDSVLADDEGTRLNGVAAG